MTKSRTSNYHEIISQLAIFRQLDSTRLESIIKHCHIQNCKKGEIVFIAGEKVKNFYLLLQGSLELSLENPNGNNVITAIIDHTSAINSLPQPNFSCNVLALKNSTLLAIPTKELTYHALQDSTLAYNLLVEESQRNQHLTSRIKELNLYDSTKKVGQFLLKNSMSDQKKNENFYLKSSKAEIASYLGITPETLSRIFNKLKADQEIKISKNLITLTKQKSLCSYCEDDIAQHCPHNNAHFCNNKRF